MNWKKIPNKFLRKFYTRPAYRQSFKGFTLVELLVASSLIVVVFTSILALINYSIYAMAYVKNNLIASFLAQEGIELVIKARGENWIFGESFDYGLEPGLYQVDYLDGLGSLASLEDQEPLSFDSSLGYQYRSGIVTGFNRLIRIEVIDSGHLRIASMVNWTSKSNSFSVNVEDHLYDWFGVESE